MTEVIENIPLEEQVVALLKEKNYKVAAAESCTGGLLSGRLVNVSGASDVLDMGVVTYSNEAKMQLIGVSSETLESFGAVSPQTAEEMAQGISRLANSDVGVGITGIAGPLGGSEEKPVGLVYIGCCVKGNTAVKRFVFSGSRQEVRNAAVEAALNMIIESVQ